jgi:adenylate kinase family enzyme
MRGRISRDYGPRAPEAAMRRVLVIGCSGAGKSTLARRLATALELPLIELDFLYWRPGWIETPMSEFREVIARLAGAPTWIMVGNYYATFGLRMPVADTIAWLDFTRWTCVYGVLMRLVRNYGRTREGMPAGCPERVDPEFLKFVWNFRTRYRPQIVAALEKFAGQAQVYRLESRNDAERFMATIERR